VPRDVPREVPQQKKSAKDEYDYGAEYDEPEEQQEAARPGKKKPVKVEPKEVAQPNKADIFKQAAV
jgi:hypothetical protein